VAIHIERRHFISALGGAAVVWPLAAHAQRPAMSVVGLVTDLSLETIVDLMNAFRQGLKEIGFIEGKNLTIDYRSGNGRREQLPEFVAGFIRRQVSVIVAIGSGDPARAAKAASSTIPIVFAMGGDPVFTGLIPSLNRPGANITGVTWLANALQAKQLELLRELRPSIGRVAYLQNQANFTVEKDAQETEKAAQVLGLEIGLFKAATQQQLAATLEEIAQQHFDALIIQPDPLFASSRDQIVDLAAHLEVPTIYSASDFVSHGGLMSYSADRMDAFRNAGLYTGRVLKGEKPADLPTLLPTKYELAINLKTAKKLGVEVPVSIILRADEVIE
jgi:putative ABC transport system substrate-binding protein